MATKLGAELVEELTTGSEESGGSNASNKEDDCNTSDNSSCEDDDADDTGEKRSETFPIMAVPVEIRAKILNMMHQRQVPCLRLVCKRWRDEVDQFYEFAFSIYDTTSNLSLIRNLRCRECVIWKLTRDLDSESLFQHPSYLKVIKVFGPTSSENLKNLISSSTNLEHLTLTRRANYPSILNLTDTPALNNLKELRFLRLNSGEHILVHTANSMNPKVVLRVPPMMDCFFPKLKVFEILKRFPLWHYSHYVTSILNFVSRHASSLTHLDLDFIPLSCIVFIGDDEVPGSSELSSSDDDHLNLDEDALLRRQRRRRQRKEKIGDRRISSSEINLPQLCTIRLKELCITTPAFNKDIHIWKSLLESQAIHRQEDREESSNNYNDDGLKELRFEWMFRDGMSDIHSRIFGFPWTHFQKPIEFCSSTLVHVQLTNLSMVNKTYPASSVEEGEERRKTIYRVTPFDLSIFRHCNRLKNLSLKCWENHARISPLDFGYNGTTSRNGTSANHQVDEGRGAVGGHEPADAAEPHQPQQQQQRGIVATVGEILLMINASDLPTSLESLEIYRFTMLTTDIEACVKQLVNLRKLEFHECGKTNDFGVGADSIRYIGRMKQLKFLEILGFNDSTDERKRALELIFQQIGRPFEGQDTWLEFTDGSTTAYDTLSSIDHDQ